MPKHLDKRRRQWYAYLNIPAGLRPIFGRRRFLKSLETESLSIAEVRVLPIIAEWKHQIAVAKGNPIGDSFEDKVAKVRQHTLKLKAQGVPDHDIQRAHDEIAMTEALGDNNSYKSGDEGNLLDAVSVAHGTKMLLSEHVENYLQTKDVTHKTLEMVRRDLVKFCTKFRFAEDATRRNVVNWANVTLGEELGLSVATRSRMISACRGYWDYLERYKELAIDPPFHNIIAGKSKRKTKAEVEAKRKAFRVTDYHKILSECKHDQLSDLIKLGAYTGCRIEELCGLRLEHVTHDRFELRQSKTEAGWRTVPIHDDIKQIVARLVNKSKDGYLLSGLTFNKYDDRSNAIGKRFGRLKKSLGYGGDYVFHSFRKGFATQLENAGLAHNVSARLMGHSLSDETFGGYSEGLAFERLRDAISHVDWTSRTTH